MGNLIDNNIISECLEKRMELIFSPVKNEVSYELIRDQIYNLLKKSIITRVLMKGDRILESQIAKYAGVSRVPVREAIRKLESEDLIEHLPRRGLFVTGFSEKDIYDIYRIRGALEELLCEYAIVTINS